MGNAINIVLGNSCLFRLSVCLPHRFRHLSIWTILKNRVGGSRTTSTNYRERAGFEVYHSLLFITKLHASAASVTVQLRTCWIPAIDLMWSPGSVPISLSSVFHGCAKIHTNELKPIPLPFPASFQWPWFIYIPCSSLMMSQWEDYEPTDMMSLP